MQEEMPGPTQDAWEGNARGDGNNRQDCCMKIQFQEAFTVKHTKTLPLVPRSLHCLPNSLLTLILSTPALSHSFWKPWLISAFQTLAPYRSPILRPLTLFHLTLPCFSPTPFSSSSPNKEDLWVTPIFKILRILLMVFKDNLLMWCSVLIDDCLYHLKK